MMHMVTTAVLEDGAAEYTAALPPVRLELLSEIYAVAAQDEQLRKQNGGQSSLYTH